MGFRLKRCPANSALLGGGGVDGAIHEEGGPQILEECGEIHRTRFPQGLPTGEAVITTAGRLPARCVIDTAGPVKGPWGKRDNDYSHVAYFCGTSFRSCAETHFSMTFPFAVT